MAGLRTIEHILEENSSLYEITIFGSEPYTNYSRIMLSSVLQGDTTLDDITIHNWDWYERNQIKLYTNETVTDIHKEEKTIQTDKGREMHYDRLIIATGSNPFILPIPGNDKEGVMAFRTIEDCKKMMKASRVYKKAAVIGGGLLGLEAARGLLHLGMEVDVIHLSDCLMNNQLDQKAAKMLQRELEQQGMRFILEKETAEIFGDDRAQGIRFKDGSSIDSDLVVMAVGVKPNISLADKAGLTINKGIIVNDNLQTEDPSIYAVGECAEHNGMVYGLVKPLYEQGAILAQHICQKDTAGYQGSTISTQLKISGVDVFSVGEFHETPERKAIYFHDEITDTYKKIIFEEDKAVGAVLFGDTSASPKLLDTIVKQKYIPDHQKQDLLQPVDPSNSYGATLDKKEFVCTCNSVSKGEIIDNVLKNELKTVNEVKKCTQASSSCGGCKPVVHELLTYIYSDHFDEKMEDNRFCSCTDLTEDEIVTEIQTRGLSDIASIMRELNWKNTEGCSTCKPALEYYLEMIYPEYEQNQDTVYINEKMNALIKQDNTYSIIPQLYSGLVDLEQLEKIYQVVEKYQLSPIALTSGQRMVLNGIKKEDLTAVWADLNMPLHSVTANAIQSVKTSNSDHLCHCDKQPAIQISAQIEKQIEFIKTPYRIRIGVSACNHNSAGATSKDIGVIHMNNDTWEIYVGGSSGRHVRSGELLYVAQSEKETIEIILAFIQYYRQSANFAERTWQWIDRASIVHIREVLFDKDLLNLLTDKLKKDQMQRKQILLKN